MEKVPISFKYKGNQYTGHFNPVSGAGGSKADNWHLILNGYYSGQLHYSENARRFVFTSNSGQFDDMSDWFEAYLVSWFA